MSELIGAIWNALLTIRARSRAAGVLGQLRAAAAGPVLTQAMLAGPGHRLFHADGQLAVAAARALGQMGWTAGITSLLKAAQSPAADDRAKQVKRAAGEALAELARSTRGSACYRDGDCGKLLASGGAKLAPCAVLEERRYRSLEGIAPTTACALKALYLSVFHRHQPFELLDEFGLRNAVHAEIARDNHAREQEERWIRIRAEVSRR